MPDGDGEQQQPNPETEGEPQNEGEGSADQLPEWAQRTISNLRDAERRYKRENSTLSNRVQALESATQSEAEKAQKEMERLQGVEREYQTFKRERLMREAFIEAARDEGAIKPEAAFRLADGLDVDDDGNITNIKAVLGKVKSDYPMLFSTEGSADAGAGRLNGGTRGGSFDEMIRQSR